MNKEQTVVQTEVVLTSVDYIKKYGNKSNAIRELFAIGTERKDIAKMLNLRYQHVRNVLITPIKRPAVAIPTVTK